METFRALNESNFDEGKLRKFLRNINDGKIEVKVVSVEYVGENMVKAELESRIADLLTVTFPLNYSSSYGTFGVCGRPIFDDEPYSRPCTTITIGSDCESFEAVATEKIKDAVEKYMKENKVEGYKSVKSDNHDHSWLLNNNGWM